MVKQRRVFQSTLFRRLNNASYAIYLSHVLIIYIVNEQLVYHSIIDIGAGYLIRILVTYVAAACIAVLWGKIKTRLQQKKNGEETSLS